jgi:DHA1 family bicyclomycin/chloramphenicol resistance-like MFS transporter
MSKSKFPVWYIIVAVVVTQMCEAIYSPALPTIAREFMTTESMVEYTLSIFLFGFGVGVFVWGKLSDIYGRKPMFLLGLMIFFLGCLGCFFAPNIETLLALRFAQAFGASVGSVLTQSMCRDVFEGSERGKVFALVSSFVSLAPALGPTVGGLTVEYVGWRYVFVILSVFALMMAVKGVFVLPETLPQSKRNLKQPTTLSVVKRMFLDSKVLTFGCIMGGSNGIYYSYFSEGPFYLITMLNLSPFWYGLSYVFLALGFFVGGLDSRKRHTQNIPYDDSIYFGLKVVLLSMAVYTMCAFIPALNKNMMIGITITVMTLSAYGEGIIIPNVLAFALDNYKDVVGSSAALFGLYYYSLVSLLTLSMGTIRGPNLWVMPLFFFCIAGLILLNFHWWHKRSCSQRSQSA